MSDRIARLAEWTGMTKAEFKESLRSAKTCPLCSETGESPDHLHSFRQCLNVLDVMQDTDALLRPEPVIPEPRHTSQTCPGGWEAHEAHMEMNGECPW